MLTCDTVLYDSGNSFNRSAFVTSKLCAFVFKFLVYLSLSFTVSSNTVDLTMFSKLLSLFKQHSTSFFIWVPNYTISAFLFCLHEFNSLILSMSITSIFLFSFATFPNYALDFTKFYGSADHMVSKRLWK